MLELKYTHTKDTTKFVLTEMTGAYNALTNLGGWNAPNEIITAVVSAKANFYLPVADTCIPSTTAVVVNMLPALPSAAAPANLDVTFASLGVTKPNDGWYTIEVAITASDDYSFTIDALYLCDTNAKLLAYMKSLSIGGGCCSHEENALFNELMAMYHAVQMGFCCDKKSAADLLCKLRKKLSKLTNCC